MKVSKLKNARTAGSGFKKLLFSGLMNILLRINICGGLTVFYSEMANFLNPQNVSSKTMGYNIRNPLETLHCLTRHLNKTYNLLVFLLGRPSF